jgi:hypothetical protein
MAWLIHCVRMIMGLARLRGYHCYAVVSRFDGGRTVVTGFESEAEAVLAMHADWHHGANDTWVWARG